MAIKCGDKLFPTKKKAANLSPAEKSGEAQKCFLNDGFFEENLLENRLQKHEKSTTEWRILCGEECGEHQNFRAFLAVFGQKTPLFG